MDKYANTRIETYLTQFKDAIRDRVRLMDLPECQQFDLMQFVYDYERLTLTKEELNKPKRVINSIPDANRCCAKRANNEQCTRIRKMGHDVCGTHFNNTPYGKFIFDEQNPNTKQRVELKTEDIGGIIYYIDKHGNVYNMEDVVRNVENPRIIGTYTANVLRLQGSREPTAEGTYGSLPNPPLEAY
jgi:hypothetical protein